MTKPPVLSESAASGTPIKDGLVYDAKQLLADVEAMVQKQKRAPAKTTAANRADAR